jgi:hypothetical protein
MKLYINKIRVQFSLLALTGMLLMGCSGGKDTKPPLKGLTKPEKPVMVREAKPREPQNQRSEGPLKADFDFNVLLNGKATTGNNTWDVNLQRADSGLMVLTGPKQEAIELRYRLDKAHPRVEVQPGSQMRMDVRNALVKGALVKHLTLGAENNLLLGIYSGQSDSTLKLELPGRWSLSQGPRDPDPVRTDKEGGYYSVPLALRGPGQNAVIKPGESKIVAGFSITVLESEVRVLNPGSPIAAAFEEGGAYRYRLGIFSVQSVIPR